MADGPSSTIVFDGNSTGAVAALHAVDVAAKNTAQAVQGTGAAMSKIGDGADAGVDKAVNATKRFEAQLKRLNLELESGGRNTAAYIEGRAKMAGADTTALAPLLAQYDQIKAKQALANAEFVKSGKAMTEYGMGVKATSAALRQVPSQFTDIIVSLQGGQAPLTVLLQQGGQLKDVFGGVGNAFKALSGYVFGLINPVTIAIGAVATLGAAYYKGAGEAEAYNKALITTGNAAGVTAGQLSGMAKAVSQATGGTIGAAAEALANIAGTAGIAAGQFERVSAVAVQMQKLTGVAVSETVKQFAELGKEPVKASEKLNETTHYLTAAVYEQIKALEDQGRTLEAGALAQTAYASAMESRIPALTENLGYVQRAWNGITGAAKGAWDAMLNVGRPTADVDVIGALKAKIADTQKNLAYNPKLYGADLKNMQANLVVLERMAASKGAMAAYDADRIKRDEASIKLSKEAEKYASNEVKMAREIAKANADFASSNKSDKDIENYGARLRGIANAYKDIGTAAKAAKAYQVPEYDKLIAAMDKANTQAQQEISTGEALSKSEKYRIDTLYGLVAAYNAKKISATQLAQAESYLDKVTREMASAEQSIAESKALAEAQKAIDKARTDAIKSHAKELESLGEKAQKLEDEVAMYGLSKEAIEELTTARMLDQIEVLRGFDNSAEEIARIEQVIEARKRLAAAGTAKDIKDGNKKVAEDAAKEWEKYADQIGQSLTDQLMEGGKSGAEYIENLFRTMILRPVIQALVTPIAQSVSSSIMSGGSSGGASGFNIFNSTSGLGDGLSVTLGKTASTLINNGYQQSGEALAGMAKAANTYSSQITMAGNALSYFSAAQSLADGKYGAAAGQAIGTYFGGPIGGSIGNAIGSAIDEAFGGGGGPKSESTYGSAYGQLGDTSNKGLAGTYATGVEDAWKTLAKELEITTALKVGAQTSIDTQGDAQTIFDAYGTVNGQVVSSRAGRLGSAENVGRDEAALQAAMAEETTRLLFAALKASDLPEQYKTYLSTIGDSVADMTEAMTIVAVVDDFNDALQSLPFENLKTLSFEAAKGLIEVAGGMDVLGANLGTYYTNFYSAEEQRAQTIKTINATVGNGFDAASTSVEQFRATVEAAMLDTSTEGLALTAKLLGVSGAMGALTKESEAAAEALAKTNQGWQDQLDVLTGTTTERDIALRDATDESTRAIMRQVYAQEDLVTAADKATADAATATSAAMAAIQRAVDAQRKIYQVQVDASQEAVTEIKSIFDTLGSGIKTLYGQVDSAKQAAQGRAFIDNALSNAQRSGYLPDNKDLADAVQAAMNDSTVYASQAESDFAKLALAGSMSALKDISGTQLSAAEKALQYAQDQLKALDGVLDSAQKQIDAINGVDTSVKSVAEALGELARALTSVNAAAGKGGLQGIVSTGASYAGNSAIPTRIPTVGDGGIDKYALIGYAGGAIGQTQKAYTSDWIAQELQTAVEQGYSASEIAKGGQLNYGIPDVQILAAGKRLGLPGFAVGTNYVPSDMIAQIHEGEAIVPKAYNPAAGGQSSERLEALVEGLTKEVQRLQSIVNDGNNNTRRTADAVNGRPEMPMLVETV